MASVHDALTVDTEFEALCPPLAEAELAQLRANLEADGCRDPLVVWGCNGDELILDGHNRYRLCGELGITFKTKRLTFADRDEAKRWIITNQLGRRNLSDEQRTYLIGLLYNASKGTHGGDHGNQHTAKDQIDTLPTAADAIAEQFAVSVPTVKRAGKFAAAIEKIADAVGPEAKAEILAGKSELTKAQIAKAADASNKSEVKAALKPQKPEPKPKRQPSSAETLAPILDCLIADLESVTKRVSETEGLFSVDEVQTDCVHRLKIARKAVQYVRSKLKE